MLTTKSGYDNVWLDIDLNDWLIIALSHMIIWYRSMLADEKDIRIFIFSLSLRIRAYLCVAPLCRDYDIQKP